MEYNKSLADLMIGDEVEGFYLLKTASARTTAAGKPFLNLTVADTSGTLDGVVWDYAGPIGAANEGSVIKLRGRISEYRGARQLVVERIRAAGEGDCVDPAALVPSAPVDGDADWNYVLDLMASLEDGDYAAIAQEMLRRHEDDIRRIPAAKSVHHSFLGGLLMHTANMLRIADFLADQYAETVDRSLLLAGTLLHDFSKRKEFSFSPLGLAVDYSVKGQLLGHLVMGAQEISELARELNVPEEKSVLLQHMILSHHDLPEYGSPKPPMFPEAEVLHTLDLLDARMYEMTRALKNAQPGGFTERIWSLERRLYRRKETPRRVEETTEE